VVGQPIRKAHVATVGNGLESFCFPHVGKKQEVGGGWWEEQVDARIVRPMSVSSGGWRELSVSSGRCPYRPADGGNCPYRPADVRIVRRMPLSSGGCPAYRPALRPRGFGVHMT